MDLLIMVNLAHSGVEILGVYDDPGVAWTVIDTKYNLIEDNIRLLPFYLNRTGEHWSLQDEIEKLQSQGKEHITLSMIPQPIIP